MISIPPGYAILTTASVRDAVAGLPDLARRLGGPPAAWKIQEIGDGNMNQVFDLTGPTGGIVVKQSLPYIRSVGESWPFPIERIDFEHEALGVQARAAPGLVPEVYHYDPIRAFLAMERPPPPHLLPHGPLRGPPSP